MPFPAQTGVMVPEDFITIHRVYTEIAAEPWFTKDPARREQFALSVIDAYRHGQCDQQQLLDYCRQVAQTHFGDGGIARVHVASCGS